jgi:Protein kinase domain
MSASVKTLDLRPYGMDWSVSSNGTPVPMDFQRKIATMRMIVGTTENPDPIYKSSSGTEYKLGVLLGGGTYGKVYEATRVSDGKAMVMKIVSGSNTYQVVKESIIQIMIVELTKDLRHDNIDLTGPYAPVLYEFAHNFDKNESYIFSEKMRATTHAVIKSRQGFPDDMRTLVITLMLQISTILKDLWRICKFNHRDFKTDNCMYFRDSNNKIQTRLIDFGFSCIRYGDIDLNGGGYQFKHCSLPARDMTQYLYEIYKYHQPLPPDLKDVIEKLLTFPLGKKECLMYQKCAGIKEWKDSYSFMNNPKHTNPNGVAEVVFNVFKAFAMKQDVTPALAYVKGTMVVERAKTKKATPRPAPAVAAPAVAAPAVAAPAPVLGPKYGCPAARPNYNPESRRCLKACRPGYKRNHAFVCKRIPVAKAAKKVAAKKACPPAQPNYNPKTRRCSKACPPGKKRNSTFKCVKVPTPVVAAAAGCPADKPDRNPKTGRCLVACKPYYKRDADFVCRSTRKAGRPKK